MKGKRFIAPCLVFVGLLMLNTSLWSTQNREGSLPSMAVLDQEYVLFECQAAQETRTFIESQRRLFQSEIDQQEKALRQEETDLQEVQKTLTEDAFHKRRTAFEKRVGEIHMAVSQRRSQLERTFNKAREEIVTNMMEIVSTLSQAKGIKLVFPKGAVLYAKQNLDLTQEVLDTLNKKLPKIDMERLQKENADD